MNAASALVNLVTSYKLLISLAREKFAVKPFAGDLCNKIIIITHGNATANGSNRKIHQRCVVFSGISQVSGVKQTKIGFSLKLNDRIMGIDGANGERKREREKEK